MLGRAKRRVLGRAAERLRTRPGRGAFQYFTSVLPTTVGNFGSRTEIYARKFSFLCKILKTSGTGALHSHNLGATVSYDQGARLQHCHRQLRGVRAAATVHHNQREAMQQAVQAGLQDCAGAEDRHRSGRNLLVAKRLRDSPKKISASSFLLTARV